MTVYNCACNDTTGYRTLAQLRTDLMVRLGYAAQLASPPPGMTELLNSFLQDAQRQLDRRPDLPRRERMFTWTLVEGDNLYDLPDNDEGQGVTPECTRKLDPQKIVWVGVERDGRWWPLEQGIDPALYTHDRVGWPTRYEVRQCIEVWPTPDAQPGKLRVRGYFGLDPFTADSHTTTLDDNLVFLLALANAKAHYGQPDAANYIQQMELMLAGLVAGSHQTARYIPGRKTVVPEAEPVWVPLT